MRILVIHPRFSLYGGGELLCLHTIKALIEEGHDVTLATDSYSPVSCHRIFGEVTKVLHEIELMLIPAFRSSVPRFMAYQRIRYAGGLRNLFLKAKPDVIFSTQSTLYHVPKIPTVHMIYDMVDLSVIKFAFSRNLWKFPYYRLLRKYRDLLEKPEPSRRFLSLSKGLSKELQALGQKNRFVFPPIPLDHEPLPKKKQVIQATRIVPIKRLEEFNRIASLLPDYDFRILGLINSPYENYSKKLIREAPPNVHFKIASLKERSNIMRESKVYLYTSHEPGLPVAFAQGIGAGCFPVSPSIGGGKELIETAGIGLIYKDAFSAARHIKSLMESNNIDPEWIRKTVLPFSPEAYEKNIKSVLSEIRT